MCLTYNAVFAGYPPKIRWSANYLLSIHFANIMLLSFYSVAFCRSPLIFHVKTAPCGNLIWYVKCETRYTKNLRKQFYRLLFCVIVLCDTWNCVLHTKAGSTQCVVRVRDAWCVNMFKKFRRIWHVHMMRECTCQAKKFAIWRMCCLLYLLLWMEIWEKWNRPQISIWGPSITGVDGTSSRNLASSDK